MENKKVYIHIEELDDEMINANIRGEFANLIYVMTHALNGLFEKYEISQAEGLKIVNDALVLHEKNSKENLESVSLQ